MQPHDLLTRIRLLNYASRSKEYLLLNCVLPLPHDAALSAHPAANVDILSYSGREEASLVLVVNALGNTGYCVLSYVQ